MGLNEGSSSLQYFAVLNGLSLCLIKKGIDRVLLHGIPLSYFINICDYLMLKTFKGNFL